VRERDPLLAVVQPLLDDNRAGRRARPKRRAAAVIGLDVADYSLMMGRDEEDTHQRIGRALNQVARRIRDAGGEIFSFSGDGLMAMLPSARDAIRCAVRIQSEARNRNRRLSSERRILFRIGINAGGILVQEGRAGGEAVNIAARLEQLAESGGICISGTVFEEAQHVRGASFTSLGQPTLKNIRQPVPVYRVMLPGTRDAPPATVEVTQSAALKDPRPSVAVLPLRNVESNAKNEYFAEGVVEDIIVSLGALQEVVVISRSSAMAFAKGHFDPREVGRLLGVGYVVSGSLRRTARSLRVSVELADAETGVMLWADTSETPPDDLFAVQDRIVQRILSGIAPHIREKELRRALRRRPENMTAYDLMLQALHVMRHVERDAFAEARHLLQRAMDADPNFAMPVAWAAMWHAIWVGQAWSDNPQEDAQQGLALTNKAIELEPQLAMALAVQGHLKSYLFHDYEGALVSFERALAAGPNNAVAVILHALTLAYVGRTQEAIERAEYGIRLSPLDRRLYLFHNILAWAHYGNGTYQEALRWARMCAAEAPGFTANLRTLMASLVAVGEIDEARRVAARLLELEPDFSMKHYARTRQPFQDTAIMTRYLAHLRAVGLPP
jgi:adenylate cyclase